MKILYLCTSIDNDLKKQVKALRNASAEVDILDIIEYKLIYDNGKKIYVRPKSKYKLLEYFYVLDEINEYLRRKEIFDYLDEYDVVHVYKSSQYAMNLKEKIQDISLKYVITPNELFPKDSSNLRDFFKDSAKFFFSDELLMIKFNHFFGYKDKSILLYNPIDYFVKYDQIDSQLLDKLKEYLSIDDNKITLFCHFSGSYLRQKALLKSIVNLTIEIKKATTFLLYFDNDNEKFNKELVDFLEYIRLDYVVINTNMTKEQIAMMIKLSQASIFIDYSIDNDIFLTSLYAKNHVFVYNPNDIEKFFRKHSIFIDNFVQFQYYFIQDERNKKIYQELYNKNREKMYELFHPQSYSDKFLSLILEVTNGG